MPRFLKLRQTAKPIRTEEGLLPTVHDNMVNVENIVRIIRNEDTVTICFTDGSDAEYVTSFDELERTLRQNSW